MVKYIIEPNAEDTYNEFNCLSDNCVLVTCHEMSYCTSCSHKNTIDSMEEINHEDKEYEAFMRDIQMAILHPEEYISEEYHTERKKSEH